MGSVKADQKEKASSGGGEKKLCVGVIWNCAAELKLLLTALLFLCSCATILQFLPSRFSISHSDLRLSLTKISSSPPLQISPSPPPPPSIIINETIMIQTNVHKQQIKPISDADVVGADGADNDAHIETVQVHEGDEDELDLEPQQKQPPPRPQPQRRPSPSSQQSFPMPSPLQQRRPPAPSRPPQSVVDDFSPPPASAAPPSRGGGIVVERGLPPEEWPNMPMPMPSPFGGFLNGEYPWIGEGYDKLGSFERLHDQLPEHIRKNIELIAGRGNGLEDLFSDDNVHGCSIM